jgi:hypothetical protein
MSPRGLASRRSTVDVLRLAAKQKEAFQTEILSRQHDVSVFVMYHFQLLPLSAFPLSFS